MPNIRLWHSKEMKQWRWTFVDDEYLTRCVVETSRRTVYIYSNEGDKKTVECDTPEEFMSVLNYVREHAPVDTLSYVDPT